MNRAEIERLAAAVTKLRPDWQFASLVTYLTTNAAETPLWDAARALAWIATEPGGSKPGEYANDTPRLFTEPGPWWTSQTPQRTEASTPIPQTGCTLHVVRVLPCEQCRRDAASAADPSAVRAILDGQGIQRRGGRAAAVTQPTTSAGYVNPGPRITDDQAEAERARQLAALDQLTKEATDV